MTSKNDLRLAVDIGGTFTDTVLMGQHGAILATKKTPTTPENPTYGAIDGVARVLSDAGFEWADVTGFIHGTTLATNALIERRGARVVSITNEGFRDILEIGYERRYSQYDINLSKPDLLVTRDRCLTIAGRISAVGEELGRLDEAAVPSLVGELKQLEAEAVAICLLHAYANPVHEQRLRDLLKDALPDLAISISSDVSPEVREFDRLCTTIANAYIQPMMAAYLADFARQFASRGVSCPILMMTAGGGITTLQTAAHLPIRLVESGPAGGAILAARIAAELGLTDVLSFDMGGTTAKLCLIDQYKAQSARRFEIARAERFIKGSGMPVRIPVMEMIEIGAGGGSIASVDRLGRVQIGPESAGSVPGPAAFGNGGVEPTVTDADILQGLIEPAKFAEGRLAVDAAAAEDSIAEKVGTPLGVGAMEAASGVSEIVDENMAAAGRMHAVESGKDLSTRTMIAFGGNGPLHATRVARRSGVGRIVVPRDPGVGSAVGFLRAPVSFEIVRSRYASLDAFDAAGVNALFADMLTEATEVVSAGAPDSALFTRRIAFMRYHGQGHEIEIGLPDRELNDADLPEIRDLFETEYSRQFAREVPGMRIEVLNWSVQVSTPAEAVTPPQSITEHFTPKPDRAARTFCEISNKKRETAVFDRASLKRGATIKGPALIVEPQTTTYVSADFSAAVDAMGNLVLEHEGAST
ncbi:MAG: hydantoinase/oxoprolinase family protein [Pseudomonadota bacterium]